MSSIKVTKKRRHSADKFTTPETADESSLVEKPKVSIEENADLDISNWWTALQDKPSILASFNKDCLLHIFAKLEFSNALHLGITCRRLYYYWAEAQKTVKNVELTRGPQYEGHSDLMKQKTFFIPNNSDGFTVLEKKDLAKQQVFLADKACLLTSLQKSMAIFPNLRYLEVSTGLDEKSFGPFLSKLTSSSLPLLTTLKLYPQIFFCYFLLSPDYIWRPLAHLELPTLRHLTFNSKYPFVSRRALPYEIPPLPILSQLTSINFFANVELSTLYQIIRQLVDSSSGLARLTPGEGGDCQFGLPLPNCHFIKKDKPLPLEPELLSFLTYLEVRIGISSAYGKFLRVGFTSLLTQCLPQMTNLQKIELTVHKSWEKRTDYPSFLTALTSLELLRELSIDSTESERWCNGSQVWPQSSLPVLPSVRLLALKYTTEVHSDVVQHLHLTHCFPELRLLMINFWQMRCFHCGYKRSDGGYNSVRNSLPRSLPLYQACGRALSRGVLALQERPEAKDVLKKVILRFTFLYGHFSSLENLLAGKGEDPVKSGLF